MTKKYTTKQEIPYERSDRDDPRYAVHQLREFIEVLQKPERLRNAFNTLIRNQAITADDGQFNKAYLTAMERRDHILNRIDKPFNQIINIPIPIPVSVTAQYDLKANPIIPNATITVKVIYIAD